jgi:hypothetical protein
MNPNWSERDWLKSLSHSIGCAISSCCPSGKYYSQGFAWMTSYYSPGLYCPSNYHTCSPPPSPYQLSSASGETIAFCCPSSELGPFFHPLTSTLTFQGYICPAWQSQSGGTGIVYDACNSGFSTGSQVVTVGDNIYDQSSLSQYIFTATGITTLWQIAFPIQIRWQSSDFITSSIQSTDTKIGVTGPTSTSTSTAPELSPAQLSRGAIDGIVIGSLIGAALLIGVSLFLFFFRRRRARSTQPINDQPKAELPGAGMRLPVLQNRIPTQLPVHPQPNAELEGSGLRGPISASRVSVQRCHRTLFLFVHVLTWFFFNAGSSLFRSQYFGTIVIWITTFVCVLVTIGLLSKSHGQSSRTTCKVPPNHNLFLQMKWKLFLELATWVGILQSHIWTDINASHT